MEINKTSYDLIVFGGGTSGVAAAISASGNGLRTLLVEKNSFLGGAMTGGLVVPMMKNNKNSKLLSSILEELRKTNDSLVYRDGNEGWFNPEAMKCVLEDFCIDSGVEILYGMDLVEVVADDTEISRVICDFEGKKYSFESKYFVDATGDADLAFLSGVPFESGDEGANQPVSLRFIMSGVDIREFTDWISGIDSNSDITSVYYKNNDEIHFSTAFTFDDDKDWALKPFFEEAIKKGILNESDAKYFQLFSVPGQFNSVAFNCPRIDFEVDTLNPYHCSKALLSGRNSIRRIAEFCREFFPGFIKAYVSNIASNLGVRDSRRIVGRHVLTKDDIGKRFNSVAFGSDYPFDIHSNRKNNSVLGERVYYEAPVECLRPINLDNLFVIGRCISADFQMQSSLRIQPNCFAMGEYIGHYIYKLNYTNA